MYKRGADLVRILSPPPLSLEEYPPNAKKVLKKGEKEKKKGESLGKGKKVQSKGPKGKNEENREKRGE